MTRPVEESHLIPFHAVQQSSLGIQELSNSDGSEVTFFLDFEERLPICRVASSGLSNPEPQENGVGDEEYNEVFGWIIRHLEFENNLVAAAKLVEAEENQRNGAAKNRAVYAIVGLRKSSVGGGTDDPMRRGLAAYGYYDRGIIYTWKGAINQYTSSIYGIKMMGSHFVPNLTIGAPVIESLRKHTKAYLDCHLMVTNPIDYVEPFGKAGASGFTFHVEVSKGGFLLSELSLPADNWQELVQKIKAKGMKPGISLKPGTPVEEVFPLLECENPVEMVLIMTVEPGFGGQKFMPEMMDKVRVLRKKYPSLDIEVDGGLGPSTIDLAASAGANCIVAGSSVFGAPDPAHVISLLYKSVENAQKSS
ncbi:hypothetical protein SASPL_106712 [Salvia splendens]|uniref:ribulose-phosphate 3-epimerase n=1 Tax=Salvia splendens TaxID=180675 RepID=A0A8X9A9U6_SALSN|nr:hypothetical protein SASPL_106712 [Salvia splendens]